MTKMYTLEEIADMLKVTRRTLYTYVKSGKLKAVKLERFWRVSEEALQDFLQNRTNGGSENE